MVCRCDYIPRRVILSEGKARVELFPPRSQTLFVSFDSRVARISISLMMTRWKKRRKVESRRVNTPINQNFKCWRDNGIMCRLFYLKENRRTKIARRSFSCYLITWLYFRRYSRLCRCRYFHSKHKLYERQPTVLWFH